MQVQVGLSDEERDALVAFLRERVEKERLPCSSQLQLVKRFLSKIEAVRPMSSELERGSDRSAHTKTINAHAYGVLCGRAGTPMAASSSRIMGGQYSRARPGVPFDQNDVPN
jgi:hypothetical protein